jgi:hypothetical protein
VGGIGKKGRRERVWLGPTNANTCTVLVCHTLLSAMVAKAH